MNVLSDRRESTREICFIPCQGAIDTIGDCPTAVDSYISIANFIQAEINEGFGIRFDDCFIGRTGVMVV